MFLNFSSPNFNIFLRIWGLLQGKGHDISYTKPWITVQLFAYRKRIQNFGYVWVDLDGQEYNTMCAPNK